MINVNYATNGVKRNEKYCTQHQNENDKTSTLLRLLLLFSSNSPGSAHRVDLVSSQCSVSNQPVTTIKAREGKSAKDTDMNILSSNVLYLLSLQKMEQDDRWPMPSGSGMHEMLFWRYNCVLAYV